MTLQKNIFLNLIGLLLGTLLLIAGVGYMTTRDSIRDLRATIMQRTEQQVVGELQHYFGTTGPAIEFMRGAVFEDAASAFENWRETGRALAGYVRSTPELSFLYYADAESGDLVGVQRDLNGTLVLHHTIAANDHVPETFSIDTDGALEPYEFPSGPVGKYDARQRPWYREAVSADRLVWTAPYEFADGDVSGITATLAERDPDGGVRGVYAVDMFLGDVAGFLDGLLVGEEGAVFILLEDGSFLVDEKYRTRPGARRLREALAGQDLGAMMSGSAIEFSFKHDGAEYFALLDPVQRPGDDRLGVAVVVPASEFMGVVRRNAWMTALGALFVIGVAIGMSIFISHRITRPLADISEELERIGELQFDSPNGGPPPSSIREIARFNDSVGRMKVSLQSFSRYVPQDVVRSLLKRRDEARLGGELGEITVQFSDLAGFTSMSESLGADETFRELRIFLETLARHETVHGGITSNFTGDGSMAIYNAPELQEGHARNACEAALDIVADLREINAERGARGRPELHARIGINTAEVLIGNLGTRERFTYTAVGDGVNLASRLEGLNKLYGTEILVGEPCRERAGDAFEWRCIDRIAVVGRRRGITIYEPLGRTGEVAAEILEARDRYQRGLEAYFAARFQQAQGIFGDLRSERIGGTAAAVLHDRIGDLLQTDVPEGWDGTHAALVK